MIDKSVFLQEEQIKSLFIDLSKNRHQGLVISMDNDSVFHAFTEVPVVIPSGKEYPALFIVHETIEDFIKEKKKDASLIEGIIIHLFIVDNVLKTQAFFYKKDQKKINCIVKFIPEKSELYSRSKGLLEISVLENKTVGIVGLGSGGSPIAVELAKAGIGKFVLIDFDRIELSNVARHVCGISDLGRLKTLAVKDLILNKNPYAIVNTFEIDVNEYSQVCTNALSNVDVIICASDNDKSRFLLNDISLKFNIPAIFGRAITRAIGGDVLRVRPHKGPCYNCLYSQDIRNTEEEISQKERQAKKFLPEYTSEEDLNSIVQVGLSSDIAPITNFMVKLTLVELSRGINSGISSLEEDLIADYYIWANRRENVYDSWSKLEYNFNKPSILRWYGAKIEKDANCMICGI
ncbi:MAG: ThiF family adenylyltransferase [Bacteroidales bacterium]|nr:ThiF family adenylyltransferase [Bacteroidales bacterium]